MTDSIDARMTLTGNRAQKTEFDAPRAAWSFNAADLNRNRDRFWRCPVQLIKSGRWAEFWRPPGTRRGGGIATSLLPILALHTWEIQPGGWTRWQVFTLRRLARLSGLAIQSVVNGLRDLERRGLLECRSAHGGGDGGRPPMAYHLSTSIYPTHGEPWHRLPASLLYGGLWSLLPTPAVRHLLVTILGLDPVRSEEALLNWEEEQEIPIDYDIEPGVVEQMRSRHPMSLQELTTCSGMHPSTVRQALRVLQTPLDDDPRGSAILESGPARGSRWYTVNERIITQNWDPAVLNNLRARRTLQRAIWGKAPS